jgi:ABC-type glycerol-3-phosphate transport system permease component
MTVQSRFSKIIIIVILSLGALLMLTPLLWAIFGSLKTTATVFDFSLPETWRFSNYPEALQSANWLRYFLNSAIMAGGIAVSQTLLGAMAGYSLAKFKYPGRGLFFALIIGSLTLSQQVVFIPMFIVVSSLNWIDTFQGLIVPLMVAPFSIFLMRQYIYGLTDSIIEVARIDGATEPRIFFQIIIPLSTPVLAVVFILSFTVFYNDLLWPLIVTRSEEMQTVALAIQQFKSAWYYRPELVLAVAIVVIMPITILFFILQKNFLRGISIRSYK